MCLEGLATCVFETGLAVIALIFIAAMLGLFDHLSDKDKS